VSFLSTNVNLNRTEFVPVATGVGSPEYSPPNGAPGEPSVFHLEQYYPNPFNPATEIRYQIPEAAWVRLAVYDVLDREVVSLVDERKSVGTCTAHLDGRALSTGVYFYRLEATCERARHIQTRKMLLLR
jgi:hypothetical protein